MLPQGTGGVDLGHVVVWCHRLVLVQFVFYQLDASGAARERQLPLQAGKAVL